MPTCPKGHTSTESDYCSDCGAKMDASVSRPVRSIEQPCPDCGTIHAIDAGKFCEICGYNFSTGAHGELAIPAEAVTIGQPEALHKTWEAVISIDLNLRHPDSPPPIDQAPQTILLEKDNLLVGRTSQIRAIFPDIALDFDDAVSHRHLILHRQDNTLTVRDIGSSNGTKINGIEIAPMIDITINPGDEVTIGHWTTIKLIQSP